MRARMTVLPVATINAIPRKTPMETCARVSLVMVRFMTMGVHLEGCPTDLGRCTRLCYRSTRHLDPETLPSTESAERDFLDESQIFHDMAEIRNNYSTKDRRERGRSRKDNRYHSGSELRYVFLTSFLLRCYCSRRMHVWCLNYLLSGCNAEWWCGQTQP